MKFSRILPSVVLLSCYWCIISCNAFLYTTPSFHQRESIRLVVPVEQLDFDTGEVLNEFASQAEAARAYGMAPGTISQVLSGRAKSAGGFFWRRKGDHTKMPTPRLANPFSVAVEQVDMKTGEVINVYSSAHEAAAAIGGLHQSVLRVVNDHKDRCSYKEYFWRKAGDPSPPRVPEKGKKISHLRQKVQQCCPQTGEVIATFDSSMEAGLTLGIKPHHISKVLRGIQATANGFSFKTVGKPEKFKRNNKRRPVHQVCVDTGEILQTFRSANAAGKAVGVATASISSAVRGKTNTSAGYRWVYVED